MNTYQELLDSQRAFFNTNATKSVQFRKEQMKKLLHILKSHEKELDEAIYADFKKSAFENFATELSLIYSELKHSIKMVNYWSKKKYVSTNLANLPGSSYIIPEPLGNTLIIGAWNYPYLLSLHPAISAMAAGNTIILKPSELAMNTSNLMAKLINENFDSQYFHVVEGGVKETTELLQQKFDKIFYTGSSPVGKIIMRAASEHLTPVVLELGGKSPAIITKGASINMAAKRLVWGKFLNGGQTCVAPDYLMVDKSVKQQLIEAIKKQITKIHGDDPQKSEAFVRIINPRHFDRITQLMDQDKIIVGGQTDKQDLYIAPTLMDHVSWDDAVMKEEIFGPVLPIIEYEDLNHAIAKIKAQEKPLALYLFTNKKSIRDQVFHEISFGGGALNETIMHLANPNLPFGGVGNSGTGSYHGEYGFAAFSHQKSIIQKPNWFEPFVKYAPYSSFKLSILKKLM
jgi:aldehyde dehydrogenase (NAD+)